MSGQEIGWGTALVGLVLGLAWLGINTAVRSAVERAVERTFRQWEVRFTLLHERRMEAIAEVWERLVTVRWHLDRAAGIQRLDDPRGRRHIRAAFEAGEQAVRYFATRQLFLPKEIKGQVKDLLDRMHGALIDLDMWAANEGQPDPTSVYDAMGREGRTVIRQELPQMIDALEQAFREEVEGKDASPAIRQKKVGAAANTTPT